MVNVDTDGRRRSRWTATLGMVAAVALVAVTASCNKDTGGGDGATVGSTFQPSLDKEYSAGTPRPGGQLSFGLAAETSGWNPYKGQWASSAYIVGGTVFDPLAAIDPQGNGKPYLAERFDHNADFTQWTIKLRPGISFHNAQKLDAEAVRLNLQTGRDQGLTKPAFAPVKSLIVTDPLTLTVEMNTPWSTFPLGLATQAGYMAAPEQLNDPEGGQAHPIGTGPFIFQSWNRDNTLKVRRNATYWQANQMPYLESIEFRVLADIQGRGQALDSGSVDAMEIATPDALLKYQDGAKKGDYQMYTDVNGETDETIIALNTSKPPFNDPIARQALAAGLDQRELSETSYRSAFPGAWGPFAETSPNYITPQEAGYPKYDPVEARRLVEEYKTKHPGEELKFTALIPPDPVYSEIAQALQQRAKEFGVEVELQQIEQAALINRVLGGDYQASGFVLWSAPTLERGYIFLATDPQDGISLNYTRNANPRIKAAMDEARTTDDPAKQKEAYNKVQKELAIDLDKIFLVHNVGAVVYRNNVHGVRNTKFPDTDIPAYAGWYTTPFLTRIWKDQAGSTS